MDVLLLTVCRSEPRCAFHLYSFPNVKISAYKKGPEAFDQWCRTNQVHAEALTLLKLMLQLDPSKRISALDASLVGALVDCWCSGRVWWCVDALWSVLLAASVNFCCCCWQLRAETTLPR